MTHFTNHGGGKSAVAFAAPYPGQDHPDRPGRARRRDPLPEGRLPLRGPRHRASASPSPSASAPACSAARASSCSACAATAWPSSTPAARSSRRSCAAKPCASTPAASSPSPPWSYDIQFAGDFKDHVLRRRRPLPRHPRPAPARSGCKPCPSRAWPTASSAPPESAWAGKRSDRPRHPRQDDRRKIAPHFFPGPNLTRGDFDDRWISKEL